MQSWIVIFNIVEDEMWNYVGTVKMKYEILELSELITNFVYEENTETEKKSGKDTFIIVLRYALLKSGKKAIRVFNDTTEI